MTKRTVRILKHIGAIPVVAVCTNCAKEFRASTSSIKTVKGATEDLQEQFDQDLCTPSGTRQD